MENPTNPTYGGWEGCGKGQGRVPLDPFPEYAQAGRLCHHYMVGHAHPT
jgi:hypothetical protein